MLCFYVHVMIGISKGYNQECPEAASHEVHNIVASFIFLLLYIIPECYVNNKIRSAVRKWSQWITRIEKKGRTLRSAPFGRLIEMDRI